MNRNIEHLSEAELARAADSLMAKNYSSMEESIRTHLEDCEKCSLRLMELVGVFEDENKDTFKPIKQVASSRRLKSKWLVAASIFLAAVLGIFAINSHQKFQIITEELDTKNKHEALEELKDSLAFINARMERQELEYENQIASVRDSHKTFNSLAKANQEAIASLYSPNTSFEEELNLNLRGGELKISSVKRAYTNNDKILFTWEDKPTELSLVIYTNKGLRIIIEKSVSKGYKFDLSNLNLGLYYYELFYNNDLVYSDKFSVE